MFKFLSFISIALLSTAFFAHSETTVSAQYKIELGRYLFHDVRLSVKGNRSCALCHTPDTHWTNTFNKVPDIHGEISRLNTPSLLNIADNRNFTVSTYNVQDLESAVSRPLLSTDPLEMGATPSMVVNRLQDAKALYAPLFLNAYGDSEVTYQRVTKALAAFTASIVSMETRYHRFKQGERTALTEKEQRGLAFFESDRLNCTSCHAGELLNATKASQRVEHYNVGLYGIHADGEYFYPSSENGLRKTTAIKSDDGKYRTPSLINVINTSPWGHDGSYLSLSAVIDSYARGGRKISLGVNAGDGKFSFSKHPSIQGFTITEDEKSDLLAFLKTLTIENFEQLKTQTQSPFCQLVKLKNRTESPNCIESYRVSTQ
ncbi:cytochrome-c peroxidase [Vibrio ichthyoenteri]|nr:cytochrome-c peroxidase [Vibrio ichthyoenteri]